MDAAERLYALSAVGVSNLLDSRCQDRQRQGIDAADLLDARPLCYERQEGAAPPRPLASTYPPPLASGRITS